jgi:hypothetical protein
MKCLNVKMTRAYDGGPLAVVDGLPGGGAELRPHQLRQLAYALARVADETEKRKTMHRGKPLPDERRVFLVDTTPEKGGQAADKRPVIA